MRILKVVSLGVILLGIVLFIVGGMTEVNASEDDYRMDWENHRNEQGWNGEKEIRKIADDNMFASWLKGFSQILVFAGIGFILYDIAKGGANPLSKFQESRKDDSEIEYTEMDSVMVCPHCIKKFKFPKVMEGSVGKCPCCDGEITLKEIEK